tara:strand:+ start:22203 stop:22718 length:516 start_codon:yes stop_codon:yes gene_type:complete
MVIWVTGLSASGKTTLCKRFIKIFKKKIKNLVFLDGDIVREIYGNDLGFRKKDREKQISRIQALANFLEKQSFIVIVAALYSSKYILQKNRRIFKNYTEVYLKANMKILLKREFKNLYKKALKKEIKNVVGVDIPWYIPKNPHLTFDMSEKQSTTEMSKKIYKKINKKLIK